MDQRAWTWMQNNFRSAADADADAVVVDDG